MDKFIEIVNNDYQEILRGTDPKYHLFFDSINWWKKAFGSWSEKRRVKNATEYDPSTDISKLKSIECKYLVKKTIKKEVLQKIHELITNENTTDFKLIRAALEKMYDYNLPSTIPNLDNWKKYKEDNPINIMIMGAGPLGLYTALYLNEYYNKNIIHGRDNKKTILNQYVNILIIDNRIYKEGIKKPYTRVTQFGFDITQIQPFIKQIFCWKNNDVWSSRKFDFINVLENLLYISAYHENISMKFTKQFEDYNDIKKFMKKEDIHYLFDCTGGRLKNSPNGSIKWNKYKFIKDNQEVKYNNDTKYFELLEDNKLFTKTVFVLELLDKSKKQILVGNAFGFVTDESDHEILNKYRNMCFLKKDYITLSKHFKSDSIRHLLSFIINDVKIPNNKIVYVRITYFNSIARHAGFAAIKITDRSSYIKLGDSLGGTEFGIIFGMKSSVLFSKHICNLLSSVKYF